MKKSKNAGFTLFELLAVLAIMAIIAGIAVPRIMQTITNARIQAVKSEMGMVANAVQRYAVEKELGSCIGGFYVIHPSVAQDTADVDADLIISLGSDGDTPAEDTGGASNLNVTLEYGNAGTIASDLEEYVEGGIPAYLTVQIVMNTDELVGEIIVKYGEAVTSATDPTVVTESSVTKADLDGEIGGSSVITKTFELGTGDPHDHTTDGT